MMDGLPVNGLLEDIAEAIVERADRLDGLARQKVDRTQAVELVSELSVLLNAAAARLGARNHGFHERRVREVSEEEDEHRAAADEHATAAAHAVSLVDVMDEDDGSQSSIPQSVRDLVHDLMEQPPGAAARIVYIFIRRAQAQTLRAMIAYIWHEAKSPWEMMKRCLAITRRYSRTRLRGISMTEVARLLNEKSRCAAVSARERDVHDEMLIRWGVRAPKAADAGLKGATACERSRRAAMGNSNRKTGRRGDKETRRRDRRSQSTRVD